jgi:hypothetical protein
MDAATTNKVLKSLNPAKVLSKMRTSRRKRRVAAVSASSSITVKRKVQFGCETTMMVHAVHYFDPTDPHCMTAEEEQQIRWYSKKELHAMFLKDLEEHLRDQVAPGTNKTDGRGLEIHFADHQRRKDQAERWFKAIVEQSYAIRKAASSYSPMKAQRQAYADVWAEDLAEYLNDTQYTTMSRDWALAQAAQDEAEARAIHEESNAPTSVPVSNSNKQEYTSTRFRGSSITCQGSPPQCQEEATFKILTAKSA